MKKCYDCNIEKPLTEYYTDNKKADKRTNYCKSCVKIRSKKWHNKNPRKLDKELKEYKHNWYLKNKERTLKKQKKQRDSNPEKYKLIHKKYYEKHRKEILEKSKEYQKEYRKTEQCKIVRKRCYEKTKKKRFEYHYNRLKKDPIYKLKNKLRSRLNNYMNSKGFKKNKKHLEILGCSFEELKVHLEKQFKPKMTWENHGKWHIDHIIPLSSAQTEEEVYKLSHYTNLQPLWAEENLKKNAKI